MSKDCPICGSSVEAFMAFGKMPIANAFLLPEDFQNERFFDLDVGFCENCAMVQLMAFIDREELFHEHYAYSSSISNFMSNHFKAFAISVRNTHLTSSNPFVVEIGSNDGIMLRHFAADKIRHLGVEPSANVARAAMEKGVNTISKFFDKELALEIRDEHGHADVILAANVMCHIPYLHSVADAVASLMKQDGVFIFEDPYLGDIIEKTAYDQIYDEHAFYFSVSSLSNLFGQYDLEIVNIEPQSVHGGSMRYTVARKGSVAPTPSVSKQKTWERSWGLSDSSTFHNLRNKIEQSRDHLLQMLHRVKGEGNRIIGYGATSKSTTVLNYCGIDIRLLDFISDTTPTKQGKFSPGTHIPIKPYDAFIKRYPEYTLLFAWNHGQEILQKEEAYIEQGGRFIVYVPSVKIIT